MTFTNNSSSVVPSPARRVGARRVPMAVVVVLAAGLITAGCGGAVTQAVSDIATQPACDAISDVQQRLNGVDVETIAPDQLAALQTTIGQAGTAIGAVGDQVAGGTSEQLDAAQERLDTAVSDTQGSVEERRAGIRSALDAYAAQLETVKEQLGC